MAVAYSRGNRFSAQVSIADAAVDWQGLDASQYAAITVDIDGLPSHPKYPELYDRAEAIYIAAEQGLIDGLVQNEDGFILPPRWMKLNRLAVAAFIAETEARLSKEPAPPLPTLDAVDVIEKLLTKAEVCEILNISSATLDRRRKESKFPEPTHVNPNRWRSSVVAKYITNQAIEVASAPESDNEEDI